MELLSYLQQMPLALLVVVLIIIAAISAVMAYQYAKVKGIEGIRVKVYQLILDAEHRFKESGQGMQKLKWVAHQARSLLPKWLQYIISDQDLIRIVDKWVEGVKDLLDDGKVNGSQKEE